MSNNQKIFHMNFLFACQTAKTLKKKMSRTIANILICVLPVWLHCSRAEQVQFQPVVHWHVVSLKFPAVLF